MPPEDPAALARAVLEHPKRCDRERMESVVADYVKQFTWEPVVQALEEGTG